MGSRSIISLNLFFILQNKSLMRFICGPSYWQLSISVGCAVYAHPFVDDGAYRAIHFVYLTNNKKVATVAFQV